MFYTRLSYLCLLTLVIMTSLTACGDAEPAALGDSFELDVKDAVSIPAQASQQEIDLQGAPAIISDAQAKYGYAFMFRRSNDEIRWRLTNVAPGTYEVSVSARAELYEGAPELELEINDKVVKLFTSEDYETLSYGTFSVNANQTIRLKFTNDLWGGSSAKDRNIAVEHLSFKRIEAPPEPTPEPTPTPEPDPTEPDVPEDEPAEPEPADPEPTEPEGSSPVTVTYQEDGADFPNPERGFHGNIDIINETNFAYISADGYTLARTYIRLDDYLDRPLDAAFLDNLKRGLSAARTAGIKIIPRFAYNFPIGDDYQNADEAPLNLALQHIAQLEPIYAQYHDVIAVHPAGFVGAWGEWHSSGPNNLDSPENKLKILEALLAAMPADIMIQLRYPGDLIDIYPQVLTAEEAFSDSDQPRVGHHNDCFLSNLSDTGTYDPSERREEFKRYLDDLTRFTAVGGETCQVSPELQRTDCDTAVAEMARFRWDYLNVGFWDGAINRFKSEGCFDEISKRLGYRYALSQTEASATELAAGETFELNLTMSNSGFGKLYKPRPTQIVLKERGGDAQYTVTLSEDSRKLLPAPGETVTVPASITLPADLRAATYDLYLALPDANEALRDRPEFSIRLANEGVWDGATGLNALNVSVQVN